MSWYSGTGETDVDKGSWVFTKHYIISLRAGSMNRPVHNAVYNI